jgi:hypothetical protein
MPRHQFQRTNDSPGVLASEDTGYLASRPLEVDLDQTQIELLCQFPDEPGFSNLASAAQDQRLPVDFLDPPLQDVQVRSIHVTIVQPWSSYDKQKHQ